MRVISLLTIGIAVCLPAGVSSAQAKAQVVGGMLLVEPNSYVVFELTKPMSPKWTHLFDRSGLAKDEVVRKESVGYESAWTAGSGHVVDASSRLVVYRASPFAGDIDRLAYVHKDAELFSLCIVTKGDTSMDGMAGPPSTAKRWGEGNFRLKVSSVSKTCPKLRLDRPR